MNLDAPNVAQAIIHGLASAFPHEQARKAGIIYWPDPLPTPRANYTPDPLVLFRPGLSPTPDPQRGEPEMARKNVLGVTFPDFLRGQGAMSANPGIDQIPIGLVDIPENQEQLPCFIDLHGSQGPLSGGPLLIAGSQNSGKATTVQTMLLWLSARYTSQQFQFMLFDPAQELAAFCELPHMLRDREGNPYYFQDESEDQIASVKTSLDQLITTRKQSATTGNGNKPLPLIMLIVNQLQLFGDSYTPTAQAMRDLIQRIARAYTLGVYVIITIEEVGSKYVNDEFLSKMGTRLGLFLSNQDHRYALFGRNTVALEPIAGRGLIMTRQRVIREMQVALPSPGFSEQERNEGIKAMIRLITRQGSL